MLEVNVVDRIITKKIHPRGKKRTDALLEVHYHVLEYSYQKGPFHVKNMHTCISYKSQVIKHLIVNNSKAKLITERMQPPARRGWITSSTLYKSKNLTADKLAFLTYIPARKVQFWRAAYNLFYSDQALNKFIETRMIAAKLFWSS